MHVLEFLERLKDIYGRGTSTHNNGECLKVHILLKTLYPQAKGYYNSSHILTEIDNHFYDLNGEVDRPDGSFLPLPNWTKDQLKIQFRDVKSIYLKSWLDR